MLKRWSRFRLDTPLGRVITMAVGFALLVPVATPIPAQINTKALDCNSDIMISLGVQTGQTVPVTLTVISGPATDAADVPVIQTFPSITFFPSCSTTLPCVVDTGPPQPVTLGALTSTTCDVAFPWTATPNPGQDEILFTFTPVAPSTADLTLPAPGSPLGTTQCDLVFDVTVDATATGMIAMQANTDGVCDPGGLDLNSSAQATAVITPVPTLGEIGLIALALLLGLGTWIALRRRPAGGAAEL